MQLLSATVKLQSDSSTEELVLPIPDDWLNALDWRASDTLNSRKRSNGGRELTNRTKAERYKQTRKVNHCDIGNTLKQRRSRHDAAD
jgi:hypothetical protein